jgi:hypothetical protein
MTLLSIAEAARVAGKDRSTINRYLKNGQISSVADTRGRQKIDTSELMRVFGELRTDGVVEKAIKLPGKSTEQDYTTLAFETLKEQLRASQERERENQERETWLKEQLATALERNHELEQRILALPEGIAKKPGLFARLFGG